MANLKLDLKDSRDGPLQWTKENHFRLRQTYRVYRWDGKIALVKDGFGYEVKLRDRGLVNVRPMQRLPLA